MQWICKTLSSHVYQTAWWRLFSRLGLCFLDNSSPTERGRNLFTETQKRVSLFPRNRFLFLSRHNTREQKDNEASETAAGFMLTLRNWRTSENGRAGGVEQNQAWPSCYFHNDSYFNFSKKTTTCSLLSIWRDEKSKQRLETLVKAYFMEMWRCLSDLVLCFTGVMRTA